MTDGWMLHQEEAFARIRLLRSPNIGPVTYGQLMKRFGTAQTALTALPEISGRASKPYVAALEEHVSREIANVRKSGARYLFHDSPDYPQLLRQCEGAPPILIVRGNAQIAHMPCVALVGARNASSAAVRLARDFALALAEAGFTIVSGLARGIDGAGHNGALAVGGGATVGVIASGIDIAYPREHVELQERIAQEGLLMTEQPPGMEPFARHFPSRNRIIAGLAAGTVVVEAAPKSGSLITARLAAEFGREVMAIPGSPLDARSHGCNQLIRDGAILVQRPEDVVELLSDFDGVARSTFRETEAEEWCPPDNLDDAPAQIVDMLSTAPVPVDELIRQSGATASAVQLALLELEIVGRLQRHAGGRVSLFT